MKMLSRILVLVTLVCSYTINAQTVDEIIDNYFENTGGVENWEKKPLSHLSYIGIV